MRTRRPVAVVLVVAGLVLAGCGDDDGGGSPSAGGDGGGSTIHTVPALQPVVDELVTAYNQSSGETLGVAAGTQAEATQAAREGRPAVLPVPWLAGIEGESVPMGRSLAVIAVPQGNPSQVSGVDAFGPDSGLNTVACGPDSPVGNFTAAVIQRGGVQAPAIDSSEQCPRNAVTRVASGELAAAIFFRPGVALPPGVEVVPIPDDQNFVIDVRYLPGNDPGGADFGAFLGTDQAVQILTRQGYLP